MPMLDVFLLNPLLAERLFQDRAAAEKRRTDAVDAIAFLESRGVVNTPGFFWYAASGERLLDAIKRRHEEDMARKEREC